MLAALNGSLTTLEPSIDVVLVFQREAEELVCVFSAGARAEYFRGVRVRIDANTLASAAALRGHHVELTTDVRPVIPTDRTAVAIPMLAGNNRAAIVYASSRVVRKLESTGVLVRAVSHAAAPYALALEREADRNHATYDGLTGLHTARAFRDILQADLRSAELGRATYLALWFIDTDGFKHVNDALGHAAGDAVLQRLARLLRECLRPELDLAARNGGDEFCAILRNMHKSVSIERAQSFCDAVRTCDFGIALPITASIGVAAFPYDAATANQLLETADAAMYHSKRSGRNRVSFPDGCGGFCEYR